MESRLFLKIMGEIARKSGLSWDGENNVVSYDDDSIFVFISDISGDMYDILKRDLFKHTQKGPGYEVFARLDCESYGLGKIMGNEGDAVRIRLYVLVSNPALTNMNIDVLKHDIKTMFTHFRVWDNLDKHMFAGFKSAA